MSFGGKQSFYFLVKWRGRPSSQSTWEDEYFLRDQYEHILKFAAIQVVKESVPDKGQSQTVDELLSQVITAKSLFVRGLEACMPELARGLLRDIFDTEMGSKNSMLIQAVPGYEVFILDYIDISKVSSDKKLPALVVVGSEDSARWRGTAAMYYPSLQIYHEDIIREKSGQDFRSKLIQLQKNSEKFDVVLLECEIVLKYFMDIGKTNWGTIVFDVSVGNSIVFKTLDTFNKPFNRTLTPRIACIPVLTVQSVGKAVINQTISLQVALRRFTNSPSLGSALLAHGLFPSAKDQTLDFYLSTTPSSSLLSSVPSSELAGLENRLERPVEPPQVGQLGRIVLRTIILRLSDLSKGRYADILKENSGWLAEAEKHKKHEDTYIGQMRGLAARLCAVEEELLTKTVDEDSKVLEADSKLRWLIKYFEALKLSGLNERIVLVFVSEKAQLRSLQILQRFTKYSLWQINDNIDSAERNIRIAEFSRVKHKTAIMTVHFKNIWRLRGVQSNIILIMGNTGESYQEELKKVLLMVDKSSTLDLRVFRLAYEGTEERLIEAGRPINHLSSMHLNSALTNKFNYVINVSTIYKLEQVDHTFKRLLDDAQEVKKGDQCIIDKTAADSSGWQPLIPGIGIRHFDYHFENVTEDANPLASWQSVFDKSMTAEELKNREKLLCRVKIHKNRMYEQISGLLEVKEPKELFNDNPKLEFYLQKRFLSSRLEKSSNLPQPYSIHNMNFMKMLSFLDFVSTHGLQYDSIEDFYKRFSLSYPEEVTSSQADMENFKNFVKEFIHLLAYRGTKSFADSIILCGFEMRAVYRRVLSLTIMAKLVQKYAKKPEDFMNQEKVSVGVKLVPKRKGTGQICYDYREACWNNYDLYCLCSGISRHGFGEWEAILKDEVVWAMHLKSNEPDPTEDDIDEEAIVKEKKQPQETFSMPDILMRKLIPSYAQYSQKGSHALNKYELAYLRSLNELLKRRASNFTNLVYENSSHFKLLDS